MLGIQKTGKNFTNGRTTKERFICFSKIAPQYASQKQKNYNLKCVLKTKELQPEMYINILR